MKYPKLNNSVGEASAAIGEHPMTLDQMKEIMDKINRFSLTPLEEKDIFAFQFELSNSNVDAYYTKMTKQTLDNYAERINTNSVPLQPNHDGETFPIGRIFDAEVVQTEDGIYRLLCTAYIVRDDNNANGISGSELIRKIETGVQRDVSIGFLAGGYTCSVCGGEMVPGWFSRAVGVECEHIPGEFYDGHQAYAWVENGIILEGSLVYTGATPQAIIQKALNMLSAGKLTPKQINSISKNLHVNLVRKEGDVPMKAKDFLEKLANSATLSDSAKERLAKRAAEIEGEEAEAVEALSAEISELEEENASLASKAEELETKNSALEEEAQVGRSVKEKLIEETIAEGVRALGDAFDKDTMQNYFSSAKIEQIEAMKNQYTAIVSNAFSKDSLNKTRDQVDDKEEGKSAEYIHAESYK